MSNCGKSFYVLVSATLVTLATVSISGAATFHVDQSTGSDMAGCGTTGAPCQNIQRAINLSSSGDEIRVAAGTYTFDVALQLPPCDQSIGGTTDAVVCVVDKELTLLGGFTIANWTSPDPQTNVTTIDGEDLYRGIVVHPNGSTASLTMSGFTVEKGRVQGAASGGDVLTFAFGAGLLSDFSRVVLSDMVFRDNQAHGGDLASTAGGAAAGGGVALRATPAGTTLTRVTFESNLAEGGSGADRGGYGQGGGLFTGAGGLEIHLSGQFLTFDSNIARAGSSSGSGLEGVKRADGQGGGARIGANTQASLSWVTATDNQAIGGNATTATGGRGGGGFGGGIYAETASLLEVTDSDVRRNVAQGGTAYNGGLAQGGGFMTFLSPTVIERTLVIENRASGGDGDPGAGQRGSPGGGGALVTGSTLTIANTIFGDNLAEMGTGATIPGGGGGALFLLTGVQASIVHTTLARNRLGSTGLAGEAIVVVGVGGGSVIDLDYSIVADHTSVPGAQALLVQSGNVLNLLDGIFSGNGTDTNNVAPEVTGLASMQTVASIDFVSPGTPDFNYHLLETSPAIDASPASTTLLDVDGEDRDASPDIGADEFTGRIFADGFESGNMLAWSNVVP